MIKITKNLFNSILNILEPEKISKINVRESKYIINIHPKYYFENDNIDAFSTQNQPNTQQPQSKELQKEEVKSQASQNPQQTQKTNESVDKLMEDETQRSQADKIKNQKNNQADQPNNLKQAQEMARDLRLNEIKSIFTQVFNFYNENLHDIDVTDFNPIFDNLITQFIKQDIIDVVNEYIYADSIFVIKTIIKCSAQHSSFCSILLDCILAVNKQSTSKNEEKYN